MEEVAGCVERITFQNEETGYAVLQVKEVGKRELTCVVGILPGLRPGETVRFFGSWKTHLVHGRQFEAKEKKSERPADVHGIKKYLGSGLIKGIGPVFASKIVEKFGLATLDVFDQSPEKLREIPGLGGKKLESIQKCWNEQRSIREVMIFLQAHGVSPAWAQKIFKRFGEQSIAIVTQNPYRLARDIHGIGFRTADEIAQKLGMKQDADERIDAGLEFVLEELSNEGHMCYPEAPFLEKAREILHLENVAPRLETLIEERRIERLSLPEQGEPTPFVWLHSHYVAESGIAWELHRIRSGVSSLRAVDTYKAIDWTEKKLSIELASNQKGATALALSEKVLIITGGPGTGKSTITKAILAISEQLTTRILLAAPTGRAAKRMSEICKRPAKTLHALLEFNFQGGFKRTRDNPLDADLLIVDEASMIDTFLMHALLRAVPTSCRLIFVGDVNQLPSVGPGNVLKDMIASKMIPVATLNEIFRQAAGSRIILNAHRINKGEIPDMRNEAVSDFFFIEEDNPQKALDNILGLISSRLPMKYGFSAFGDIQVLAPMRKGILGTENLNLALQEKLNKNTHYLQRLGRRFAVGDKVMQIRNNYNKEVFNGDIGRILDIDESEETLTLQMDDREVLYDFADIDELNLAYAVSIHKYQGSEARAIVIPIHMSHFKLLQRNLIYTGVTRGKELVILIGEKRALILAVKNEEVLRRFSGLEHLLQGGKF